MSDFHGGFFVRAVDAAVAEPIRIALANALRGFGLDGNYVTFAARQDCPVMHVAVRGRLGDGKDFAFFHAEHSALGAAVARAARVDVWAYHYENQSGSESVRAFAPDGREHSNTYCSWDELAEELGLDVNADDSHARLQEAAPLGVLASELGVARGVLEWDLVYRTPPVRAALDGPSCTEAVTAYLAGPLASVEDVPKHEPNPSAERAAAQTVYFPDWMAQEIVDIANRVNVFPGVIAWAAWEAAKDELHRKNPLYGTEPPQFLATPPVLPPAQIVVPASAKKLGKPPRATDKVALRLTLPERVLAEVQNLAVGCDRSLSWCVQQAFLITRPRLHAAAPA